jgi:hypothetical protein
MRPSVGSRLAIGSALLLAAALAVVAYGEMRHPYEQDNPAADECSFPTVTGDQYGAWIREAQTAIARDPPRLGAYGQLHAGSYAIEHFTETFERFLSAARTNEEFIVRGHAFMRALGGRLNYARVFKSSTYEFGFGVSYGPHVPEGTVGFLFDYQIDRRTIEPKRQAIILGHPYVRLYARTYAVQGSFVAGDLVVKARVLTGGSADGKDSRVSRTRDPNTCPDAAQQLALMPSAKS